ncbi:MAG: hypothetical protein AB1449_02510 [Chloroflexota bacterium]
MGSFSRRILISLLLSLAAAFAPTSGLPAHAAAVENDAGHRAGANQRTLARTADELSDPEAAPRSSQRLQAADASLHGVHSLPSLSDFARSLNDGELDAVRGLYLTNRAALHVVQQPADDPAYVSSVPGTATLFRDAAERGTLGFLAHNEAASALFHSLNLGDKVWIVYGDGRAQAFIVAEIRRYQAEDPSSPYGEFVDLEDGERLSAAALFNRVYTGGQRVVLQTCLARDGVQTWGRLFVVAYPAPEG